MAYHGSTNELAQTLDGIHVEQAVLLAAASGNHESGEPLAASASSSEFPVFLSFPFRNLSQPNDVTNDGIVSASDALHVINEMGARRCSDDSTSQMVDPLSLDTWPGIFFDSSGDKQITALDALLVINALVSNGLFDALFSTK